jgi:hypothetical protein
LTCGVEVKKILGGDANLFEILFVFGRNMVWSVAPGRMRFLGFASSRATKIYGDLAKIYGASPKFFATVSGLSFAHQAACALLGVTPVYGDPTRKTSMA